jgi:hypothetical protein
MTPLAVLEYLIPSVNSLNSLSHDLQGTYILDYVFLGLSYYKVFCIMLGLHIQYVELV